MAGADISGKINAFAGKIISQFDDFYVVGNTVQPVNYSTPPPYNLGYINSPVPITCGSYT